MTTKHCGRAMICRLFVQRDPQLALHRRDDELERRDLDDRTRAGYAPGIVEEMAQQGCEFILAIAKEGAKGDSLICFALANGGLQVRQLRWECLKLVCICPLAYRIDVYIHLS